MARQDVDIGVEGNDGTGDSIRESFRKVNENFTELYAVFGVEGSLSFTSLSDTPDVYEGNKVVTTNATGDAIIFSTITSNDGTIAIDVISTPGEIDLSVAKVRLVDDTIAPTLGNHVSAANFAIGGVQISEAAATAINSQAGRSTSYTIDDLVITKGYADRRYVTSGLPIRVAPEPSTTAHFTLEIDGYTGNGHLLITQHYDLETGTYETGHGLDSGANGTEYVFRAEDVDPNGLTNGQTYYIRYESSTELSLFNERSFAMAESDSIADPEKILVSGTIAADDTHSIVDAGYNEELLGNFLSDVAMPRESVTRRQGDKMEGALYLHDHPGDLAGAGTPNGLEDLQAATKYYVDNTAYSSPEVLFVSTAGDDTMAGVPAGKEGTAATYSFRTINAAARRATELVNTAPEEPGPYFQTLSYGATNNVQGTAATVISAGVESANNVDTRNIVVNNKDYLVKEITGYLAFTYPDFAYNVDLCERDLGLILDAVSIDALRGNTANYLSRTAAERYYSSVSGRIAITSQLERTDDSFAKLLEILQSVLQNALFNPKTISSITKATPSTGAIESPALVTTATAHGLANGNLVIFKDIAGMVEIEDQILYAKVVNTTSFELFTDAALTTPFDNRSYTSFVAGTGQIGLRYQDKLDQDTSVSPLSPSDNGYVAVTQNFSLIRNIIRNGVSAGADIAFGNRYALEMTNSTSGQLDQTDPNNIDALPGKVIRGKRSGAIGRIITYTQDTNSTTFFLQPLEPRDFDPGEQLEMGNFVKNKQVVIRVEAGFYEEDYPIKLTKNVSLKGDEFRRVIVRPKNRVSQSEFANTYFYRDKEFDGNTILTTGVPFINQTGDLQGYFGYHYLTDNTRALNVGSPVNNIGGYTNAANILELNKRFIQEEVIEYINSEHASLTYDSATCERDLNLILDGVAYDVALGTNYNSVVNGLAYQRANNLYNISNELANTVGAITFARDEVAALANVAADPTALSRSNAGFNEVLDIIQNGATSTDTAADALVFPAPTGVAQDRIDAKDLLQANRDFLRAEVIAWIAANYPALTYDSAKCSRDVGYIVDGLSYDVLYGGNSASTTVASSYFVGAVGQLGFGESAATSAAYDHLASVIADVVQENAVTPTSGNSEAQVTTGSPASATEAATLTSLIGITTNVIDAGSVSGLPTVIYPDVTWATSALQAAKTNIESSTATIVTDTIDYINNTLIVGFVYNEEKCYRDTGLIIDAMVSDLEKGGEEGTLEAQGQYYSNYISQFNNNGFDGQQNVTEAAIEYISTLASDLLTGTAPSTIRGTVDPDVTNGSAEPDWAAGATYYQGDFVKKAVGLDTYYYRALVTHVAVASDEDTDTLSPTYLKLSNTDRWQEVTGSVTLVGALVDKVNFAFNPAYNPPKRNDADGMDVFMMDDATIVRNVTVQGHGGFMCVLDPTGQVLTKSPYIQTATSFSRSRNAKAFSGGMFVDAFSGNIPMRVLQNSGTYTDSAGSVGLNNYTIYVESQDVAGQPQGLKLRLPQLPAPFYFEGQRFQVNAISNYDSATGRAVLYLDPNSNNGQGWNKTGTDNIGEPSHDVNDVEQDIFLQTAGYRSILSNDFTQINDLGYGLVTTNGAFAEAVSMFTYYTHAAYYAANGSEIRSLNGSNGYGFFGLVAEGANPNEIPDEVTTLRSSVQPIKAFTYGGFTNASEDTSITVYDFKEKPMSNSYIWIEHPTAGALNYRISRVENLADPNSNGTVGAAGAVVVTGIEAVNNSSITGSSPGGSSEWTGVPQKSTTGSGTGAEFTVVITSGTPVFTITNVGQGYAPGDTVTISGADIGGADGGNDLTIPVTTTFESTPGTYIDAPETGSITAATTANPVVITSASHGLTSGDKIKISGVTGMLELNGNSYYVDVLTANTLGLYTNKALTSTVNGTQFTPYVSSGTWYKEGGIGNYVFRLTLQEAGSNTDLYGSLQETVAHDTFIDYRHGENFLFTGVANPGGIKERPSTAINFDESDLDTYRSTGFTQFDDQNQPLGSDEIKSTFDATYSSPIMTVSLPSVGLADPDNGAKTLGGTVGDTKIAIEKLDARTASRILQDATDATNQTILLPGDAGYGGGMIFAHAGKVLQVIDYAPVTTGTVTGVTKADPAVVTSAGHGLSNGTAIEFYEIGGMTNLNGAVFYVGNVTANTFELYTDDGLSSSLDTSAYSAYTSGGYWATTNSVWYVDTQDYQSDGADWDISGTATNNGIKSVISSDRNFYLGIPAGTTAEITVAISLLRATGHDFTQIGSGGFNTSNYPNVLLGAATEGKAGAYTDASDATKSQVWERRKGRVFFITSDEDGFFRVGKYFEIDQSTGSITFAGEVGISRAASLGFKDGVTINEFSNDELFTDLSDTAVPTEKAIANYVSRRLGHNGQIQLTGSSRFEPGFMALDGSTKMEANLNMNSKQIKNLLDPVDDNDATTKDYVVQATQAYDEINDLRNVTLHDRSGTGYEQKQLLVPTGYQRLTVEPQIGSIVAGDLLQDGTSTGTVIATESRFDYVLNKNVQIITYDPLSGAGFNTTLSPVYVGSLGTKAAAVLENPVDEFTNAKEGGSSDVNITVNRTATDTTINLQIESQAILNSDINDDAGIAQSKLMMNRAKPLTSSAGLYGTDGDGGISIPKAITAITKASPGVVTTSSAHNLTNGELVQLSDIVGMIELNGNSYYASVINSTQIALYSNSGLSTPVNTTSFTTYVSGGSVAGEATGSGRTGQSSRGMAAFEAGSFSEDVELTFDDFVVVNAGDVIIQGSNRGYATATHSGAGSLTVVVRTDDTFTVSTTPVQRAAVVNGVEGAAVNLVDGGGGTVFVSGVKRSGYIGLHDRGVGFSKLPNLTGGNTGDAYGGSVIGRATDGNGMAEQVSFTTVVDQGRGISDNDFTTERAYWSNPPTNTIPNDPGDVLIQYGTAGAGNYAYTNIAYDNANNTIVKRNNAGKIQATSYVIGSTSTYEILSETSATLNFKTPEQGTILTAAGASKPTINTGGAIKVGDIANVSESTFQAASPTGSGGTGTREVSALAARWMYSSFIEAPDEKDTNSTGVGIGANTGFNDGGADKVIHVTGGSVRTITDNSGLTVKGNVTTTGSIILDSTGNIVYEGSADANETTLTFTNPTADRTITFPNATGTVAVSGSTVSTTTQSALDTSAAVSAAGVITVSGSAEGLAITDSPTFAGMTISNTNTLTVRAITTGAAATTGTITGTWSLGTGSKFQATYADLAELYEADVEYEVGTVVIFGGDKEVTQSNEHRSTRVAGVVSENPAYVMNAECPGIATAIALQGRVPVKVIGKVRKGDMLVASAIPGYAIADVDPKVGSVIGKAVGEKLDSDKGIVEAVVGRL